MKATHKCIICGTKYNSCDICDRYPSWKAIADTEEHFTIYLLIKEYRCGGDIKSIISKLKSLGVTKDNLDDYPSAKEVLEEIMSKDVVVRKSKGKKTQKDLASENAVAE